MPTKERSSPRSSSARPGSPAPLISISDVQGTGHRSPYDGKRIRIEGVVTGVEARGFYVQEPQPHVSKPGSGAIFVFTGQRPQVRSGNRVLVEGTVTEFGPGDQHLSSTQILPKRETKIRQHEAELPEPIEFGTAGRPFPAGSIYEAGLFYEGFEGMRVRLPESRVIGPTDRHGEIYIAPQIPKEQTASAEATIASLRNTLFDLGDSVRKRPSSLFQSLRTAIASARTIARRRAATTRSPRTPEQVLGPDGLPLAPDGILRADPHEEYPARLKLVFDPQLYGARPPRCDVGDRIGPVDGIFLHQHGFYGLKPTHPLQVFRSHRKPDVATLVGTDSALTLASYNVENLDPHVEDSERTAKGIEPDDDVGDGRFAAIARQIVENLRTPDIIALQEIEDNDGAEVSEDTSASLTWQTLIAAICEAGGPQYAWVDRAPAPGADGGRPGGNIRVGYLYNPNRIRLLERSVQRIGEDHPAFIGGRKSLAASFEFKPIGTVLHVIANHWASKHGSTPTYRDPNLSNIVGGEQERLAQHKAIMGYVEDRLQDEPSVRLVSLGDFNADETEAPIIAHGSGPLFNFGHNIADRTRYSYIHEGLAAPIDHQFGSPSLRDKVEFEYVHINVAFADKASDHDPTLSRIDMR